MQVISLRAQRGLHTFTGSTRGESRQHQHVYRRDKEEDLARKSVRGFVHQIGEDHDPGLGDLHHTFHHHHGGGDGWPRGNHDANEVSSHYRSGCVAAHSPATTVEVAGGAASENFALRRRSRHSAALGAGTRAAADKAAHSGLNGSDRRSGDLGTPAVTTVTSMAAGATSAHTAAAATAVSEVAVTCSTRHVGRSNQENRRFSRFSPTSLPGDIDHPPLYMPAQGALWL